MIFFLFVEHFGDHPKSLLASTNGRRSEARHRGADGLGEFDDPTRGATLGLVVHRDVNRKTAAAIGRLWLRLNVAIQTAMAGESWTSAAHEAGFADSAHLTRTFKRMFGINPATLVPD